MIMIIQTITASNTTTQNNVCDKKTLTVLIVSQNNNLMNHTGKMIHPKQNTVISSPKLSFSRKSISFYSSLSS